MKYRTNPERVCIYQRHAPALLGQKGYNMARQKNPNKIDRREWVTRSFTETTVSVKVWNRDTEETETISLTIPTEKKNCNEKRILNALYGKYAHSRNYLKCEGDFVEKTRIMGVKVSKFLEDAEDLTDKI